MLLSELEPRPADGTKVQLLRCGVIESQRSLVRKASDAWGKQNDTRNQRDHNLNCCAKHTSGFLEANQSSKIRLLHTLPTRETTLRSRQRVPVILSRSPQSHCCDILATSAGTARRGIKRCAKMLSLFTKPGITSPPPLANDSNASLTTFSGDW